LRPYDGAEDGAGHANDDVRHESTDPFQY